MTPFVIAGQTRNPWMLDQVRHDSKRTVSGLACPVKCDDPRPEECILSLKNPLVSALALGLLWSFVPAAILFGFKNSWNWPIALLSLVVQGLGWAMLLGHFLHRARTANDVLLASAGDAAGVSMENMALELSGRLHGMNMELTQVNRLLDDAVAQLLAAFESVGESPPPGSAPCGHRRERAC